ncbi:MAG: hypothetical protein GZ088_15225 [Acidipila sp.]|nr:hypothetical protein [Acidipila sp.]
MNPPITVEQLEQMAEHVQYEIAEFRKAIRTVQLLKYSDVGWNATIESGLLHFRILRAFFFAERGPRNKDNDDVFAEQYIVGWKPKKDPVFDATREAINKRMAHLTLKRLTPWRWTLDGDMNKAIEQLVADFKIGLSHTQKKWFTRLDTPSVVTVSDGASYSTHSD